MNPDRVADVLIRHRFTDYICTIAYSEKKDSFDFVTARYADPSKTSEPTNGWNLYLRILREPALRAMLFEILFPEKKLEIQELREKALNERAEDCGTNLGFLTLAILAVALCIITFVLTRLIGNNLALAIAFFPAVFAFLIMFPVRSAGQAWYKQRYCAQNGHSNEIFNGQTNSYCKRCGFVFSDNTKAVESEKP